MTLEELLRRLNIDVSAFDEWHSTQLKYKLQFEYTRQGTYPYDDQEYETEIEVTEFDINSKHRTITLKGK